MNFSWRFAVAALTLGAALTLQSNPVSAAMSGKMLVERKGCLSCHSLLGRGGKMGPPLQSIVSWSDAERMTKYIGNPKSVNPRSIMPKVRLKEAEIEAIVEYLQGFKDTAKAPKNWKGHK